jgi:hypothetical protein
MTNLLQDGATWLGGRLKSHAGVTVIYARGAGSVSVTASVEEHRYEVVDTEGFGVTALSRDYIVHAADLVINSAEITPRAGDRVTETIRGASCTFEVMAIGDTKEYELLDTDGVLLRIHTKKVV